MKTMIFDQDRQIENTIENWESRTIDSKCERIVFIGKPDTKFSGVQQQIKLVLSIERLEVNTIYHPLTPVNYRPSSGNCKMEAGKMCEYRRKDGKCTSDPFENKRCEYNDGECEE